MTATVAADLLGLGQRIRHLRRSQQRTLAELGTAVGLSASALSLIENGRREPKLGTLTQLAAAFGVEVGALLSGPPPSHRAALELELAQRQRSDSLAGLDIPAVKPGPRLPIEALEALVGLHRALADAQAEHAATPEYARQANARLRERMKEQNNYFPDIEKAAADMLRRCGYTGGPVTRATVERAAATLDYRIVPVPDLPPATRTVTDLDHRRIYVPLPAVGHHLSRTLALQALGHLVLAHRVPRDYAEFLEQRVEINYFAAASLMPEASALSYLRKAKAAKDISIEDLRDGFAVSYEQAAHRFTNLATRQLDLPVHFMRISSDGLIFKAYENDGVHFPTDSVGAIEGQRVCRFWTARVVFDRPDTSVSYQQYTDTRSGTYWCTAVVDHTPNGDFSVSVGVPYAAAKWMRGRETTERGASRCPDPSCCQQPPAELARRWRGRAWPSARVHSHLLAAMPPGVFPGVDETEVLTFLDRQTSVARMQ